MRRSARKRKTPGQWWKTYTPTPRRVIDFNQSDDDIQECDSIEITRSNKQECSNLQVDDTSFYDMTTNTVNDQDAREESNDTTKVKKMSRRMPLRRIENVVRRTDESNVCEAASDESDDIIKDEISEHCQGMFYLMRHSSLQFSSLSESMNGVIDAAIGISIDSSFTGILRIPALSGIEMKRTFQCEIYYLNKGYLQWHINHLRLDLRQGDFLALRPHCCFNIHNPSSMDAILIFFSPSSSSSCP